MIVEGAYCDDVAIHLSILDALVNESFQGFVF